MGTKRIYLGKENTKYAKMAGVSSIILLTTLFIVLQMMGLEITGTDAVCRGTVDDPCISYGKICNAGADSIDIYNPDEIRMDFSPTIKNYWIFFKDGRVKKEFLYPLGIQHSTAGWRYENFTNATKPRSDRVYVHRFARYSCQNYMLVGLKNNPNDIIKWGIGIGSEYLDPTWNKFNETTTEGNITFTAGVAQTIWVNLTENGTIKYATIDLKNYRYLSGYDLDNNPAKSVYSPITWWNQSGGHCITAFCPAGNQSECAGFDGNLSTYQNPCSTNSIYINYTKSDNVTNVIWEFNANAGQLPTGNWTLPDACVEGQDEIQLRYLSNYIGTKPQEIFCHDGTDWYSLHSCNLCGTGLAREQIRWGVGIYPANVTIDTGDDGSIDYENLSVFNGTVDDLDLNITAVQNRIDNCTSFPCMMPIVFNSSTTGILEYSNLKIGYETIAGMNTTLYLDGLRADRKYEYGTLANLIANFTEVCGFVNCSVCIDIDGIQQGCDNDAYSILYNHTPLRIITFNDLTTIKNLTNKTNTTYIDVGTTDIELDSFQINVTGFPNGSYPTDTKLYYDGNFSSYEEILLGQLIGSNLYENAFKYSNTEYTILNLSRSSAGTRTIYINISTLGSDNIVNFTMQFYGFDIDQGNDVEFIDEFKNSTYISGFSTSEYPFWMWDNFTTSKTEYYETTSDEGGVSLDLIGNRLNASSASSSSCGCSASDGETDYAKFQTLSQGIEQYKRIEFKGNCTIYFQAGASYCGIGSTTTGTSDCGFYITNSNNLSLTESLPGGSLSGTYTHDCGSPGCQSTPQPKQYLQGVFVLERVEDYLSEFHTFKVYKDDVFQGTTDSLNGSINLAYLGTTITSCYSQGGSSATQDGFVDYIRYSGVGNNYTRNITYLSNTTIESEIIATTTNNISIATLVAREKTVSNCSISYLLSNDNGTTYESVTNGTSHAFTTTGNKLRWKGNINNTYNNDTCAIIQVGVTVIPQAVANLSIDIGNDGTSDYIYSGVLNTTNSPQNFSCDSTCETAIDNYCSGSYCNLPVVVTYPTAGTAQLSLNFTSNPNPISITTSDVENFNPINLTFGISAGVMQINGLGVNYFGSKNFTILGYKADDKSVNDTHTLQVRYSSFNLTLPSGIDFWEVFPKSNTDKNITPYGQSNSTPIFNITNFAYDDPINIYIYVNETVNETINITFNDNSTKGNLIINETPQLLASNISVSGYNGIWSWIDLYNSSHRFEIPWFNFVALCSDCVVTDNFQDHVNLVVE